MKKYFILSGLALNDSNRGTAALGYGAFSFLEERGLINNNHELLIIKGVRNLFKVGKKKEIIEIQGKEIAISIIKVPSIHTFLARKLGILLPFTRIRKFLKKTSFIAAINGGDGFSDIYGDKWFNYRLPDTLLAIKCHIPLIILPQTLGPFKKSYNYDLAKKILEYSSKVFVRDDKFIKELEKMGVRYEKTKDLSAFMLAQPWNIDIKPGSIGINVSGLCYGNSFIGLEGQFNAYPKLINAIISHFQEQGKEVYLIPHSYNYQLAEKSNDDMEACRKVFEGLQNKKNIILLDKDLTSPEIKYVISQMTFFVGTRMHANFAAIYTGVPVFGLAYSYKFAGAFDANNLNGKEQTVMINNISESEIPDIIEKIDNFYKKSISKI